MSFQWIFDNAETLSINKRPIVSQTVSRDQHVRSISRGGAVWRFTIKMPDGKRWSEVRGLIEGIDQANLLSSEIVNLGKAAYNYIVGYRGDATNPTTMTFKYTATQAAADTTKFELGNMPGSTGAVLFRAGDFVQPTGSTAVYTIVEDVVKGSASTQLVKVNRGILSTPSNTAVTLKVGSAVEWQVICTSCPQWSIIAYDIVGWSGEFQFQEVL
jgi:hypothetical protein